MLPGFPNCQQGSPTLPQATAILEFAGVDQHWRVQCSVYVLVIEMIIIKAFALKMLNFVSFWFSFGCHLLGKRPALQATDLSYRSLTKSIKKLRIV